MKFWNTLFLILFSLTIALPVVQKETHVFPEKKLAGVTYPAVKRDFNFTNWISASFQQSFEKWMNTHFGLKPLYVRVFNQYQFSLFGKLGVSSTIISPNNYLYQEGYLNEYMGKKVLPAYQYDSLCFKMQKLSTWFQEQNKPFLYVVAPGKVSVYPEYISDSLQHYKGVETNYKLLKTKLAKYGIPHIDFQEYFLQIKNNVDYPLFPKCGTHWSGYGSTLAADSVLSYLKAHSTFAFSNYTISEGVVTTSQPKFTDYDIGKLLNLLFPIDPGEMYYPSVSYKDTATRKPRLLIIGDSFVQSFWGFNKLFTQVFSDSSMYWYYYNGKTWPANSLDNRINNIEMLKYIDLVDMVIVLSTEINHNKLAFGFVDDLYSAVYDSINGHKQLAKSLFENQKYRARHNTDVMRLMYRNCKEQNISLDSALNAYAERAIKDQFLDGQLYYLEN